MIRVLLKFTLAATALAWSIDATAYVRLTGKECKAHLQPLVMTHTQEVNLRHYLNKNRREGVAELAEARSVKLSVFDEMEVKDDMNSVVKTYLGIVKNTLRMCPAKCEGLEAAVKDNDGNSIYFNCSKLSGQNSNFAKDINGDHLLQDDVSRIVADKDLEHLFEDEEEAAPAEPEGESVEEEVAEAAEPEAQEPQQEVAQEEVPAEEVVEYISTPSAGAFREGKIKGRWTRGVGEAPMEAAARP